MRLARENKKRWEEMKKHMESIRHQEIDDLPKQLIIDGKLCNFSLEWDKPSRGDFKNECCWNVRYRDAETHEIILDSGTGPTGTYDWALSNMMNELTHVWGKKVTLPNGDEFNVVQCILFKGKEVEYDRHINKHYVIKPYYRDENGRIKWGVCPMCGSDKIKLEPYNALCPEALAGSKGTRYYCECGYNWDNVEIMC